MASSGGIQDSHEIFTKKGAQLGREKIDDHMVKTAITIDPNDNVLKAASTMSIKKMRRLPVGLTQASSKAPVQTAHAARQAVAAGVEGEYIAQIQPFVGLQRKPLQPTPRGH